MNPYIGDRELDPPEEPDECETCGGTRLVTENKLWVCPDEWEEIPCPDCHPDSDMAEPNYYPEPDL